MLPHWIQNNISANGVKIHYTRTGNGEKPPLVLAHGFSDSGLCWLRLARELESEYDVVLPDARGHGLSARVTPDEDRDNAADLAGLIGSLGLRDPIVGGHSMGGNTAATLAARYPGLASALILEDPGWRDRPQPPPAEAQTENPPPNPWFEWLQSLPNLSMEDVIAKGRVDSPTWDESELPAWAESKKQLDLNVLKGMGVWMDWRDQARGITVPALLITADPEKGAIVTEEGAREAQALSPWIRVVNVPGAGHNIRRENWPAFLAAVREFLNELKP